MSCLRGRLGPRLERRLCTLLSPRTNKALDLKRSQYRSERRSQVSQFLFKYICCTYLRGTLAPGPTNFQTAIPNPGLSFDHPHVTSVTG